MLGSAFDSIPISAYISVQICLYLVKWGCFYLVNSTQKRNTPLQYDNATFVSNDKGKMLILSVKKLKP